MPATQTITGSLVFELATGTYNLSYEYFRGTGSDSFKVVNENIAKISGFGVRDSEVAPLAGFGFDVGIENLGANEFNGSIKLDSGFFTKVKVVSLCLQIKLPPTALQILSRRQQGYILP